jgi:hypothetical protein
VQRRTDPLRTPSQGVSGTLRASVLKGRETFAVPVYDGRHAFARVWAIHSEGVYPMGDKGPGSKGGGKKPKTSTKKAKGAK